MALLYWAPRKSDFHFARIEGVTALYDALSGGSHLLSDYHLAALDQLSRARAGALGFDEIVRRVADTNDVEDQAGLVDALSAALDHLAAEALVECGPLAAA